LTVIEIGNLQLTSQPFVPQIKTKNHHPDFCARTAVQISAKEYCAKGKAWTG
jgi:hypothetical protein